MAEKQDQNDQGKDANREGKRARQRVEGAIDKTTEAASEASRSGARTMQRGMHIAGEAAERGMEAAGEAAQRGMQAANEGAREFIESTAGPSRVGEMSKRMAKAAEQTTEDLRTLMTIPGFGGGMQDMQHAMTSMLNRVVQANVRAGQEVFRLANPGAIVELQQRFVQQYLSGLIEGSAEILRASRQLADEGLRPIEERLQKMREHGSSQGSYGQAADEDSMSKVADVMTPGAEIARPDQSVQEAAQLMAEVDTGALPVGENDRLLGIITDRDIAVRVTAEGKDPKQTQVREVLTSGVRYCFDDEDIEHVAQNMADQQVRRMMVVNRHKRLVGIVSLGDISIGQPPQISGSALRGSSRKGDQQQRAYAGDKPQRSGRSRT
jgi:CBS domain-containing protein